MTALVVPLLWAVAAAAGLLALATLLGVLAVVALICALRRQEGPS